MKDILGRESTESTQENTTPFSLEALEKAFNWLRDSEFPPAYETLSPQEYERHKAIAKRLFSKYISPEPFAVEADYDQSPSDCRE